MNEELLRKVVDVKWMVFQAQELVTGALPEPSLKRWGIYGDSRKDRLEGVRIEVNAKLNDALQVLVAVQEEVAK
jgi:hypothetical protein